MHDPKWPPRLAVLCHGGSGDVGIVHSGWEWSVPESSAGLTFLLVGLIAADEDFTEIKRAFARGGVVKKPSALVVVPWSSLCKSTPR